MTIKLIQVSILMARWVFTDHTLIFNHASGSSLFNLNIILNAGDLVRERTKRRMGEAFEEIIRLMKKLM